MTDIEKNILLAASVHPDFDKAKCLDELNMMNELDSDLIKQLWDLRNAIRDGGKVAGNKNACNSCLVYFLGITGCKPEKTFELARRRTYGRSGFPDIDMDFDYMRRQEIIDYLIEKYGREYVGNIGNVQTLKIKAALRRAIKTLDPTNSVRYDKSGKEIKPKINANFILENEILKTLPGLMKRPDGSFINSVDEAYEEYSNFRKHMDAYPNVRRIASVIEGTISGFGIHAAGILLSPVPLCRIAPMHVTTIHAGVGGEGPQKVVGTQFPMNDVERMGLIKFDILGLSTKTAVDWACKSIKEERGIEIDWNAISVDDPKTLELLNSGKTDGCFQLENPGMKECLKMIGIDSFDDLVVAVAMYRPGPKDYIPEFSARKRGNMQVVYPHPLLKDITERTHGIIVYQEQVMKAFMILAGLTASDGYDFMKGCAKKKIDLIEKYKDKFFKGSLAKGIDNSVIEKIWSDLYKFSGYAFNKSVLFSQKIITTKQEYSIQELYNMKQSGEELPQAFLPSGDPVDIVDVYDHGVLPVYEITFDDGSSVSSTLNHKFMTQKGILPLHRILNENLEVIQNIGVIDEKQVDMQRMPETVVDSAQITESSTGVRKISSSKIQSQRLSVSGVQQRDSRIQRISCSQKGMSELERYKEPALQRTEQNKWTEGLGTDFKRSSAFRKVESKNQSIGSVGGKYTRRKETSFRVNEQAQQETSRKVSAKQSTNGNQNLSQKRYSREEGIAAEKMEGRASRRVSEEVYSSCDETKCMAITPRKIPCQCSSSIGFKTLSNCLKQILHICFRSSSNRFFRSGQKSTNRVRWTTSFLSSRQFGGFFEDSKKGSRSKCRDDESKLPYCSYILRHMAPKQGSVQISTVSKTVDDSSVLPREEHSQNDWHSLRIQKIKFVGYEQCYDLEIASDDHLYCLANGVVNSNSHSVSYAYESFKTAYLKSHYPAEFIAARLSVETVRRNFDDVDKYERDATKNFDFTIEKPSLNTSKLHWSIVSTEERILRKPLLIKGVGIKAAEEIVKHQPYQGKNILMAFTKKVGSSVNTKVMEAMKDAGFWEDISKKKLLNDFEQIRKDKKRGIGEPNFDMFP